MLRPRVMRGLGLALAGLLLIGGLMLGKAQAQRDNRIDYEFTNNGFEQLFEVSHQISGTSLNAFDASVETYLRYSQTGAQAQYLLGTKNGLDGTLFETLDVSLDHDLSFNATDQRFGPYEAILELSGEQSLFIDAEVQLDHDQRTLSGFFSNGADGEGFSIDVDGIGEVEWVQTTFADANFFDPDFDFFAYTDEELDAIVWDRSHFAEADLGVDFDPIARGTLRLRPRLHAGVGHDSFSGFGYEAAGAVGFSLAPEAAEEDDTGFGGLFLFENSNLALTHAGANFDARDGELVLALGRNQSGLIKLAALVFKEFKPVEGVTFSIDATGSLDYVEGVGLTYADAAMQAVAQLDPTEDWSLAADVQVEHSRDGPANFVGEFSLDFTKFERFQPYIHLEGTYAPDDLSVSVPFGFDVNAAEGVTLNFEVTPSYSRFFDEEGTSDVEASASASFLLPGTGLVGGETSEIELSVLASRSLLTGDYSLTITGATVF